MVYGLYGILCAVGVYCSTNPIEPSDRFAALLEQLNDQYVLVHRKTRNQFPSAAVQHIILLNDILLPLLMVEEMIDLPDCIECDAVYIICTSSTTGRQKAVVHTHRSFAASTVAYARWDRGLYTYRDQVPQVATSSWILHLTKISLSLILGGTVILLRPDGQLDMGYFSRTLLRQQLMTLTISPEII